MSPHPIRIPPSPGQVVQVYWNRHRKMWSVRDPETRRVIGWYSACNLKNAVFYVSPKGNERARREGRRNVHAWVQGEWLEYRPSTPGYLRVAYDPFLDTTFKVAAHGLWPPVTQAEHVGFVNGKCLALNPG